MLSKFRTQNKKTRVENMKGDRDRGMDAGETESVKQFILHTRQDDDPKQSQPRG